MTYCLNSAFRKQGFENNCAAFQHVNLQATRIEIEQYLAGLDWISELKFTLYRTVRQLHNRNRAHYVVT